MGQETSFLNLQNDWGAILSDDIYCLKSVEDGIQKNTHMYLYMYGNRLDLRGIC